MSGPFVYVESKQYPELRFQVLDFNPETGMGKLKSSIGVEFERLISKEELEKRNYKLKRSDIELPMGDWPAIAPMSDKKEAVRVAKAPPAQKEVVAAPVASTVADPFGGDEDDE